MYRVYGKNDLKIRLTEKEVWQLLKILELAEKYDDCRFTNAGKLKKHIEKELQRIKENKNYYEI